MADFRLALMSAFEGKRGLVLGVANKRSIAWAIARRLADGGAQLAFTYQGERIETGVRELADEVGSPLVTECDVRSDDDIRRVFDEVGETFDAAEPRPPRALGGVRGRGGPRGPLHRHAADRFWMALDITAYSLVACARAAEPLMEAAGGGSIVTMTYLGGERAVPHYNVMGVAKAALDASVRYLAGDLGQKNIRMNAASAGPVRTLAARSIAGFPTMEAIVEERSPLHRPIDADDVGAAATYLLSEEATNVTATTLYVDSGYHAIGHVVRARASPAITNTIASNTTTSSRTISRMRRIRRWISGSSGGLVGISRPSFLASGPRKNAPVAAETAQPTSAKTTKNWS